MPRLLPALLLALVPALSGVCARADEPPKPADPPAGAPPAETRREATETATQRTASDEEAKALVEAVKEASKGKAPAVLKSLEGWTGLRHKEFVKPLVKLLTHEDSEVARRAAVLLEAQKPEGTDPKAVAKEAERVLKDVWKAGFLAPVNDKRPVVQGAVVKVHGAWGLPLDAKEFDQVESLWRRQIGNPDPLRVGALVDVVGYAEATKDKRFCRLLAEQIDEPMAGSVHDASNPPASWWEARWKAWNEIKPHVLRALKAITGQDFKTTKAAKDWFQDNERSFGFKW